MRSALAAILSVKVGLHWNWCIQMVLWRRSNSIAPSRTLYKQAFDAAHAAGSVLPAERISLMPQDKLVEIVRRSQELALSGAGGEEEVSGDEK